MVGCGCRRGAEGTTPSAPISRLGGSEPVIWASVQRARLLRRMALLDQRNPTTADRVADEAVPELRARNERSMVEGNEEACRDPVRVPGNLVGVSTRARLLRRGALLDQRNHSSFVAGHWLDQRHLPPDGCPAGWKVRSPLDVK